MTTELDCVEQNISIIAKSSIGQCCFEEAVKPGLKPGGMVPGSILITTTLKRHIVHLPLTVKGLVLRVNELILT